MAATGRGKIKVGRSASARRGGLCLPSSISTAPPPCAPASPLLPPSPCTSPCGSMSNGPPQQPLSASSASTFSKTHSVHSSRAAASTVKTYINTAPRSSPVFSCAAADRLCSGMPLQHGRETSPLPRRSMSPARAPARSMRTPAVRLTLAPSIPPHQTILALPDGGRLRGTGHLTLGQSHSRRAARCARHGAPGKARDPCRFRG